MHAVLVQVAPFSMGEFDDVELPEAGLLKLPLAHVDVDEAEFTKLAGFQRRFNKALLDKLMVERERERLAQENAELQAVLKQVRLELNCTAWLQTGFNPAPPLCAAVSGGSIHYKRRSIKTKYFTDCQQSVINRCATSAIRWAHCCSRSCNHGRGSPCQKMKAQPHTAFENVFTSKTTAIVEQHQHPTPHPQYCLQ